MTRNKTPERFKRLFSRPSTSNAPLPTVSNKAVEFHHVSVYALCTNRNNRVMHHFASDLRDSIHQEESRSMVQRARSSILFLPLHHSRASSGSTRRDSCRVTSAPVRLSRRVRE
jgi:hypothetical protein